MSMHIPPNILDRLRIATQCRAIVLAGSHGRGEGEESVSSAIPANDIDLVLVLDKPLSLWQRLQLRGLKQTLPARLGVWHVDIMRMTTAELSNRRVEMLRFDLKYGSRVLCGDSGVCDLIPYSAETPLPAQEIENLLINRLVTLVEGHPERQESTAARSRAARQMSKCLYATIDAVLVKHGRYRTHYAAKRDSLRSLAGSEPRIDTLVSQLSWIENAWNYQLTAPELDPTALSARWRIVANLHLDTLRETRGTVDGRTYPTLPPAFPLWRGCSTETRSAFQQLWAVALMKPSKRQVEIALATWALAAIADTGRVDERDRLIAEWYQAV